MAITRWPEIKKKYKIYSSQKYGAIKTSYVNPKAFEDAVAEKPYQMIHVYLNKPFKQADQLVLQLFPHLRKSMMRCEWCCLDKLKKMNQMGILAWEQASCLVKYQKNILKSQNLFLKL